MHGALASVLAIRAGSPEGLRDGAPAGRASQAVIVPTSGAADELRRTLAAVPLPDLVTRSELYGRLHARLPEAPDLLSPFDREVLLRRAARETAGRGVEPPFTLRPGLIVEILAFYDELRRSDRTLDDFERLMTGTLEPSADTDRGAERMLRQTRFLSAALADFERRVADSGRIDEHGLRTLLLTRPCEPPYRHVIVTVADHAADPRGLWLADFDLLARMPGIERLDVVATERLLAAGFHERVHQALPGIAEERIGSARPLPVLSAPEPSQGEDAVRWFVRRDREEELAAIARTLAASHREGSDAAVVFQRPLPYLYLARQVFGGARLPFQALDSLPLAGEPFVAAIDLLFSFLLAEGARGSLVALLRSPHWRFTDADRDLTGADIAEADGLLQGLKYHGGFERLSALAPESAALRAADRAAVGLRPVLVAPRASAQLAALLEFIRSHERLPASGDPWAERHLRARAAVLDALAAMGDAHARHHDEPLGIAELSATVRRWIEGQTFSPRTGRDGVRLLDAAAAAYADVAELHMVGLVESDWPARSRRSIFYPASLLSELGWPGETERLAAARARFEDLLALPRVGVSLSTFTLEDDAIVTPSAFLDEVAAAGLPVERVPIQPDARVFAHEALAIAPVDPSAIDGTAAEWLALRVSRPPAEAPAFHGEAGPQSPATYAVSYVERYLDCPFKYFAAHVLRLPEERDDESGLTALERGQFLHEVFEAFFAEWHASGRRTITTANMREALQLFERVTDARLLTLAEADRALERTHLLGSAAAPGLAERAFAFEIEQGGEILERLLEYELRGSFALGRGDARREISLRAKADRIDLMSDGTLRVIDYKLGRAPKPARALQLPIYGVCATQHLAGRHGRAWTLGSAAYVAFKEKNAYVPLGAPIDDALAAGEARFLEAVAGIEAGRFPVDPDEPYRCQWCAYPGVCRKDYVGDE